MYAWIFNARTYTFEYTHASTHPPTTTGYSDGAIAVLDIHAASDYDVGYIYGVLQGNASIANYNTFMSNLQFDKLA